MGESRHFATRGRVLGLSEIFDCGKATCLQSLLSFLTIRRCWNGKNINYCFSDGYYSFKLRTAFLIYYQMRLFLPGKSVFKFVVTIAVALGAQSANAQLTVTSVTPEFAVNDVLLGQGVTASNIVLSGQTTQVGSFDCNGCGLNIQSGVVLASGNVAGALGPNNNGGYSLGPPTGLDNVSDPDLAAISAANIHNAAVLEFDFIPTGDSLAFDFVFGSEEYPEWVNSINDVFGFFVSGPGISGPYTNGAANIALLPGSTIPVTINTVNIGANATYFVKNTTPVVHNVQADGFTTVITAQASVICGETYHIKIAIGDASDGGWDSWVFLKEGSFQSNLDLSFNQPNISPSTNSVFEGCGGGNITLARPCGVEGDLTVILSYAGTAVAGEDYNVLPTEIIIPEGQDSLNVSFEGINDMLVESVETIFVTATMGDVTGTITLSIYDTPPLVVSVADDSVPCNEDGVLTMNISGGSGNTIIEWEGLGSANPLIIENPTNQTVAYTVTDLCDTSNPSTGSANITLVEYAPLVVDLGGDINANCNTTVELTPTVSGGDGNYSYLWLNNGEEIGTGSNQEVAAQSGIVIEVTVTDGCGTSTTDEVAFVVEPQDIEFSLGENPITTTCLEPVLFEPIVTGGTGNYEYEWTVNGTVTGNTTVHTTQVNANSTVTLTITDECGGYGYDEIEILVPDVPVQITNLQDGSVPCFGLFTLAPSISGGVGSYTYSWIANGETLGVNSTLSTSVSGVTVITLNVSDQCGNDASEAVTISLNPSTMTLDLSADDLDVCPDEQVTLTANVNNAIGDIIYSWSVPGNDSDVVVSSPTTTSYTVIVTDACNFTATETYEMVVWESTPLDVPGPDFELCVNTFTTNPVLGGVYPYFYQYDEDVLDLDGDNFISYMTNVTTAVTVTDHCNNTATFEINLVPCSVEIPNIFTPNGDSANGFFQIEGIEGFRGSSLEIYNRWGKKVFESEDYRNNWSGAEQEEGTYFYIFKRSDGVEYSGNLQLVR